MAYLFQIRSKFYEFTNQVFTASISSTSYDLFVECLCEYIKDKIKDKKIFEQATLIKAQYTLFITKNKSNSSYFNIYFNEMDSLIKKDIPEITEFFIKWFNINPIR